MAVYKIFPSSDATLYSKYPAQNTGLDSILEVATKNNENPANSLVESVPTSPLLYDDIRRSLIRFSDADLTKIKSFSTGSWKAGLKLYLANAENLSTSYSLEIRQVSQSWDMGTGQFGDSPETRNGVCWYSTSSYATSTPSWASVANQYFMTPGGGSWTGSYYGSQSFDYNDSKDVNVDVTNIVNSWFSGSVNNGFIAKFPNSIESSSLSYIGLSFFSVDTHTIYPPTLEMKWDDSLYTGSLSQISNSDFVVTIGNNQGVYKIQTEIVKFRINAREKYPARVFTTSSFYIVNKRLPQTTYWAIQDMKTTDMVIDFDTNFTKVSYDQNGSFASLYLNGLEPERYYKLLIKTTLPTGETIDVDNDCIFKITR
jgi:hypothetical protein